MYLIRIVRRINNFYKHYISNSYFQANFDRKIQDSSIQTSNLGIYSWKITNLIIQSMSKLYLLVSISDNCTAEEEEWLNILILDPSLEIATFFMNSLAIIPVYFLVQTYEPFEAIFVALMFSSLVPSRS